MMNLFAEIKIVNNEKKATQAKYDNDLKEKINDIDINIIVMKRFFKVILYKKSLAKYLVIALYCPL